MQEPGSERHQARLGPDHGSAEMGGGEELELITCDNSIITLHIYGYAYEYVYLYTHKIDAHGNRCKDYMKWTHPTNNKRMRFYHVSVPTEHVMSEMPII